MTISLGDLLALLAFAVQAGACYMLLRNHNGEIKAIRKWRHDVVTPILTGHSLRIGIVEDRLGIEPHAGD